MHSPIIAEKIAELESAEKIMASGGTITPPYSKKLIELMKEINKGIAELEARLDTISMG